MTARYLAEEPEELDTALTVSVVGRIPLLSVVLGQAYELAVHALDLVSCGAAPPSPDVLESGLLALADVTGGLAASMDLDGEVTLATPGGGWTFLSVGAAGPSSRRRGGPTSRPWRDRPSCCSRLCRAGSTRWLRSRGGG